MKKITAGIALLMLLSLGLNACGAAPAVPTPTPVDVAAIHTAAMQTAIVELTRRAPTVTPTPTITPTPTVTNTPTVTPTNTPLRLSLADNLAIYVIETTDQENCKYYPVPIPINHGFTGDMLTDVRIAVSYLLNTKWAYSGNVTNPLSASNLYFSSVEVVGTELRLSLGGAIIRHDDQCLNNQARDQLHATIWTAIRRYEYPVIETISIWVDTILFDDIMLEG
ncbi:MAG: glycoside hydrolase family protein [Anaerolineaceae bacterium]|nr:MAG: glycoside hydrolase family protein [Anaerolineaceae bacterium]